MKDETLLVAPAEQILAEQGFLVLANQYPMAAGRVYHGVRGGCGYKRVSLSLAIIGDATRDEWAEQHRKYAATESRGEYPHYAKAILAHTESA